MRKTTVYLPAALDRALKAKAERLGVAAAQLVRDALRRSLEDDPAPVPRSIGAVLEREWVGLAVLVAFVDDLAAHAFTLECGAQDFARIAALVRRYADPRLGFASASVIACAERSDAPVLTLDRRDFSVVAREGTIRLALE